MQQAPLIGLTGYHIGPSEPVGGTLRGREGQSFTLVSEDYVEAIRRAGGLPVALPLVRDEALIRAYVTRLDGLVLAGGEDVDPWTYGQEPGPHLGRVDPERDRFELALADHALQAGLPLLAVCRGMQLVNVLLGGTLHQDLSDRPGTSLAHNLRQGPRWYRVHPVSLAPGSILAELYGKEVILTNSFHHQTIDRLGRGLAVIGTAPDGVIEAVVMPDRPEFLAVQWHPEMVAAGDEEGLVPFRWLVVEASRYRERVRPGDRV